jgi:hypothetical protein
MVARLRRAGALALAALAVLLLSACGGLKAGSAAVVGDQVLTESQVSESGQEIVDIATAAELPPPATGDLTVRLVGIWVEEQLTEALAADTGVSVSAGDVDAFLAQFTEDDLRQIAVSAGIAPGALDRAAETQLLQQQLVLELAPDGTPEEQGQALRAALAETGARLGVAVNPRYAAYDATTAQVVARAADRLSSPEPTPSGDPGGGIPLVPPAG